MSEGRTVVGAIVRMLRHIRTDRGMTLCPFSTRCLGVGTIHEVVTTDQTVIDAGDRVDRVGFVGFVELSAGGVIARGDKVAVKGVTIGTVLGFDECHFPNHYNVIVATDRLLTATDLGLAAEDPIHFVPSGAL